MPFGTGNYALDFYNALSAPDHDVELPENISWGAKVGPGYKTVITEIGSGWEQRAQNWPSQRSQYEVSYTLQSQADVDALLAFFYARRGRAHTFRMKDWADYTADHEPVIARPDGSGYQLTKFYNDTNNPYYRIIEKPSGTVTLYDSGGNVISGTIDPTTGIVTGATPASWSGSFDVRVRFDQDLCQLEQRAYNDAEWNNVQLIEIRAVLPAAPTGYPVKPPPPPTPVGNSNVVLSNTGGTAFVLRRTQVQRFGGPRFGLPVGNYLYFDIPRTSRGNALIVLAAGLGSEQYGPITINNVWDGDLTTSVSRASTPDSFDTFQAATGAAATSTNVAESMGLTNVPAVRLATAAALPTYGYGPPLSPNATLVGIAMAVIPKAVSGLNGGAPIGASTSMALGILSATTDSADVALSGLAMNAIQHSPNQTTVALTGHLIAAAPGAPASTQGWGLILNGSVTPSLTAENILVNIYGRLNGVVTATSPVQIAVGTSVTITSDTTSFNGTFPIASVTVNGTTITLAWNQAGTDELPSVPLAQLSYNLPTGLVVDGVPVMDNDRILLKNGATGSDNGIYVVNDSGAISGIFVLQRSADCDTNQYVYGLYAAVVEGTVNGGSNFYVQTPNPILVGVTSVTWTSFDPGSGSIALESFVRASNIVTATTVESPPPVGSSIIITNAGTFNGIFVLKNTAPVRVGISIQAYQLTWEQDGSDETSTVDALLTYSTGLPTGSTDIWYCMSGAGGATRVILDTTLTSDSDNSQLAVWVLEFAGITQFDQAANLNNQPAATKLASPTMTSTTTGSPPPAELFVAVQFSDSLSVSPDPLGWVWLGAKQKTTTPVIPTKSAAAAYLLNIGANQVSFVQNRPGGGCVSMASFK